MTRVIDNPESMLGLTDEQTKDHDWYGCYPAFDRNGICVAVIDARGTYNDPETDEFSGTPAEVLAGTPGDVHFDEDRDGYYPGEKR